MKKIVMFVLIFFSLIKLGYCFDKINEVKIYTVPITSISCKENSNILFYGGCTGVVIRENKKYSYILTAKHCVYTKKGRKKAITIFNKIKTKIIKSENRDLAVIRITKLNKNVVTISKNQVKYNDNLYHFGYPGKMMFSQGKLILKSLNELITNVKTKNGCSGGGLFNKNNELVGITTSYHQIFEFYYSENLYSINNFLNSIEHFFMEE